MSAFIPQPDLTKHPRWTLYRKIRRHIGRELQAVGKPNSDVDVDQFLLNEIKPIRDDLLKLFIHDSSARASREKREFDANFSDKDIG